MTQPTSAQKTTNEQEGICNISIPLLKEVAHHLHLAVSAHRKKNKGNNRDKGSGKRRKRLKFKHKIYKRSYSHFGHDYIVIHRWIPEQNTYASHPLCHICYDKCKNPNGLNMRRRLAPETELISVDIADPDSFDKLARELIRLLDWRTQ